jgi:hypothetical protein
MSLVDGETEVFIPQLTFGADPSVLTSPDLEHSLANQTLILRKPSLIFSFLNFLIENTSSA